MLEESIGCKFEENTAADGVYFDEDDEVHESLLIYFIMLYLC